MFVNRTDTASPIAKGAEAQWSAKASGLTGPPVKGA